MFKAKKWVSAIAAIGLLSVGLAGCGNSNSSSGSSSSSSQAGSDTKITAIGSTALQPLVEQAADNFQKDNSGITINVQGGGSGTGLSQVQQKAVTIGNSDIFAEKQSGIKADELVDHQVAVVGMAPVVNKSTGVKNVTMSQLKDIFTGKITNWKQVGGKDQKITVINRVKGSGTRATFEQAVLGGKDAVQAQEQDSNGAVQKIVGTTPGAVSYLAFSFMNNSSLQPLSIDGVQPNDQNVETNKWKIWSYEHMYTGKNPGKNTLKFINYIKSAKVQESLVQKLGYININNMKVTKSADNVVTKK